MYGKTFWGVQRATFIIDADGVMAHIDPEGVAQGAHDEQVLALLAA